jgi:hypothetical protein
MMLVVRPVLPDGLPTELDPDGIATTNPDGVVATTSPFVRALRSAWLNLRSA